MGVSLLAGPSDDQNLSVVGRKLPKVDLDRAVVTLLGCEDRILVDLDGVDDVAAIVAAGNFLFPVTLDELKDITLHDIAILDSNSHATLVSEDVGNSTNTNFF
ncbi:hypothetical protein C0580_02880 [Candidatus Parcubacteria bacterium]|nr:MAG: hypothetical protein C0580_02880 [Candidatus Parcubacteria bacterium]